MKTRIPRPGTYKGPIRGGLRPLRVTTALSRHKEAWRPWRLGFPDSCACCGWESHHSTDWLPDLQQAWHLTQRGQQIHWSRLHFERQGQRANVSRHRWGTERREGKSADSSGGFLMRWIGKASCPSFLSGPMLASVLPPAQQKVTKQGQQHLDKIKKLKKKKKRRKRNPPEERWEVEQGGFCGPQLELAVGFHAVLWIWPWIYSIGITPADC